ncbi:hypothetical protein [Merdimmobilis hominis]|jgi:hypothetical protein|uniref:Uncharacterized protein n=1 Tax=uncultured Anaerotruncus sp. TaxID=905011 RepID=A0A6N2VHJ1_9FIRM|nr:hypothetical protein [Merdimmobilis hominis]MCD4837132.1 hypothetical protein [Merdimmobilis hominis]
MENKHEVFSKDFIPYIIKWGRSLNLFGVVLVFGPCIALAMMGIFPDWTAVGLGCIMQMSSSGLFYVIEPISYFTALGIPGTYMSFLSGNIGNLRVPCSVIAQEAVGVEQGSEEGTIIATVGIAVSIVVNTVILTLGVVAGSAVFAMLPQSVKDAFNLLLPALFASMAANSIVNNPKLAMYGVPVAGIMTIGNKFGMLNFLPSLLRTPVVLLVSVFGTIGLGMAFLTGKGNTKGEDAGL